MASSTTNLGLTIPDGVDRVSREDLNENFQIIDSEIGKRKTTPWQIAANSATEIDLYPDSRYFIIFNSVASTLKALAIVSVNTQGVVDALKIGTASNLTFDTSIDNTLKVTNSASNAAVAYVEQLT